MIKLNVSAANIAVEEKETLTEGRVGLLCQFRFTDEWAGLAKTAVFDGADSRDVILSEDTVAVPAECLSAEGYSLSVGVYGKNAAGDVVIPTVYATVGKIQRSAYPSGKEPAEPTPDVVAQIQQAAANAEALARSVREDADLGKFRGSDGGWYTPEVSQPDENTMRVAFAASKEGMPAVKPKDIRLTANIPTVSYTQFGAKLDGVSDDTQAAILCHAYANEKGCRVEQHSGILYLKTATEENCPIVKTSCDWSGMTFRIDESMGKNILMQVLPDAGVRTHSLTSEEIAQLEKGEIQIPFLADYQNCICHLTTDISIGNRLNKTEAYVYHETVTVDRWGHLLDGALFRSMTDASAVTMEYQSILEPPVTLKGARIVLDTTDDSVIPCFLVKRSNTTLEGWTFVIQKETSSDSTAYKGEILKIANCYNVTVEKFAGENFGTFFSEDAASKAETCYLLYLTGLSRFTLRDCLMIRAWGMIQSQYCKDMVFRDSTLGRIDNHYGCRNYTVSNCTLTSSHSAINIGYGDGVFLIENVRFVKFIDPDTPFQNHCVFLRGEFCALFSGQLVIRDISIRNHSGQTVNLLSGGYTDSYDFGPSDAILPLAFPEVNISRVVYDTDDVTIVNFRVDSGSYPVANSLPVQAKRISIEDVSLAGTAKHLRLMVNYGYDNNVELLDRYGIQLRIPWKSEWITNVSCSVLARDCHINNFNGSIGAKLQLENCYVYSNATTWQYVRDMVLHNCHVYIGSSGTVKFDCNHSFRCVDTVFEERVEGTVFQDIQTPELYYFRGCCCISSTLEASLASKLMDSNTITNQDILCKSERMTDAYVEWSYDELSAGAEKSFDWTGYLALLITTGNYSNIYESTLVPVSEFANTSSTHRPILCWGSSQCSVYKVDDSTIWAAASNISANQKLRVYGLIRMP